MAAIAIKNKTSMSSSSPDKKPKKRKPKKMDLETIKDLGGEAADISLVDDVEDDDVEEIEAPDEDFDAVPLPRDELMAFMKKLNFDQQFPKDETERKPKKLKSRKLTDAEKESDAKEKAAKEVEIRESAKERRKLKEKALVGLEGVAWKKEEKHWKKSADSGVQSSKVSSSSNVKPKDFVLDHEPRKYLVVKPGQWRDDLITGDVAVEADPSDPLIIKLKEFSHRLWMEDVAFYKQQQEKKKSSNSNWLRTVLSTGTTADKMAALIVMVQEAPVHNLASLDALLSMARRKGDRSGCIKVIQSVKELFVSELLLDDRKLRSFEQHVWNEADLQAMNRDARDKLLLMCYCEDQMKLKYSQFVSIIDMLSHDTVEMIKKKATGIIFELLSQKSEQEKMLLSMLVNKLGDPDFKVAANSAHLLCKLVALHPNMKTVVVIEVERLVYRTNVSAKAQYYAISFLNQLLLSHSESALANKLLSLYFSFFQLHVKKGDIDSKMMSALLTGVNRTYPYVKGEKDKLVSQADTLYKVVHMSAFNTSVQALMLISHVIDFSVSDGPSDRFFSALYRKLLDPGLVTASKLTWFLNLLYNSLSKDQTDKRVQAFIKRLLQVCSYFSPPFICGALLLLSELIKKRPRLLSLTAFKHQDFKFDNDVDDEEEHFVDVKEEEEEEEEKPSIDSIGQVGGDTSPAEPISEPVETTKRTSSWIHRDNTSHKSTGSYDPLNRNPQFCRADQECTWELLSLARHNHPTVALFSQNLLKGESISYSGDPLVDFTLIRFLDRFVFRNPKKLKSNEEGETEQLQQRATAGGKQGGRSSKVSLPAANTDEYLLRDEKAIPAHELYLYRYFHNRAKNIKSKNKKEAEEEEDSDGSIDDDEFDGFLDKFEKGLEDTPFDVDFASGYDKSKSAKKSKQAAGGSDDDDDDDLSDEEVEFDSDDSEFKSAFSEDEGEDGGSEDEDAEEFDEEEEREESMDEDPSEAGLEDFSDDDMEELGAPPSKKKPRLTSSYRGQGIFASADEFAHALASNSGTTLDMIGTGAVSRKDNADAKQLVWEADRERKFEGRHWKQTKGRTSGGKSGGKSGRGGMVRTHGSDRAGKKSRVGGAGGGKVDRMKKATAGRVNKKATKKRT